MYEFLGHGAMARMIVFIAGVVKRRITRCWLMCVRLCRLKYPSKLTLLRILLGYSLFHTLVFGYRIQQNIYICLVLIDMH
jgi:hypothetical protein